MPPAQTPGDHRAASAALVGLLLLAALLGPASVATGLAEGAPGTAPAGQTEPVDNVTDDADETVTETLDDAEGTADDTVEDTADVESVTETVDDAADAVENETTNVTDALGAGVNDTLEASGSLSGRVTAGADGNATAATDGSGDAADGAGDSTTRTLRSAGGADAGSAPRQGGGLPAAAGGVAALGAVTVAGAALLQRAAGPSSLRWATAGRRWLPTVEVPPWLRWLAGLAGYSRYDDSDPLVHDTRGALYRRIEASPGRYLSALAESADVPLSTARHHLRVLEDEGVVDTAVIRGRRCYFPASTEHQALEAAMADETQATVLSTLAEREAATVSEVADAMDVDPSTATYQLQRLAAADLVERERDGRAVRNRLAPHVQPVFETTPAD